MRAEIVDLMPVETDRAVRRPHRYRWSSLMPAASLAAAVGAVVLAAWPWSQYGPRDPDPATATSTAAAGTSGAVAVTVENLGASQVTVNIDHWDVYENLGCGAVRTYDVATEPAHVPAHVDVWAETGSHAAIAASKAVWLVNLPTGWIAYDSEPPTSQVSICGTMIRGADPGGRVAWVLDTPIASSNAVINLEITEATQKWLGQFRDAVLTTPGDSAIISSSWSVSQSVPLKQSKPELIPLEIQFSVAAAGAHTWLRYLNFDLSDGHVMGVDELFTSPRAGLAALSAETRKLLSQDVSGTVRTAPDAANFAAWAPYRDGLHVQLADVDPWPGGEGPSEGVPGTIPWSALDRLIKPDSPVRDWWAP